MPAVNGQHESKESFYHLEICCRYVGEKYGNPATAEWTNRDYIRLSSILSHATGTQISPNTLKRIFGKLKTPERYYPQKATRDALASYAGYSDWENFLAQHPRPKQEEKELARQALAVVPQSTTISITPQPVAKKRGWPLAVALIAFAALLMWWLWLANKAVADIDPGDARLVCNNPEGENPHSAVFKLVLAENFAGIRDSFSIHFGDSRRPKKILPGVLLTHYYEVPGRYYARLVYNGKDIDTVAIYLQSKGWTATATVERDTMRVYPIISGSLFKGNKMTVNTQQLLQAGVDTNKTFFVDFVNAQPTAIDGDNFELTADVTTSPARAGVRCSQVKATVYGERARHTLFTIKPGCTSWVNLQFSELVKNGEEDDLAFLGSDLTAGGIIKLQVIHKQVSVWINNKKVFETVYQQPLGKLYGVNISFAGIGTVNKVLLKDLGTGTELKDGFSSP
ncbi:hypothetical protein D3H65_07825 [Paraflavitalea soli]|uniref:Uncharacterized protein n=1 Tax=Paraflavitalea soli TaxID=2315862 RepID=A0A3B7MKS6_9BACT|nr:hypothetical protein [Paraflavitalea soli]AXY73893.1 hypothetical protein D3H65_07825 [Paraflavitalea soli]